MLQGGGLSWAHDGVWLPLSLSQGGLGGGQSRYYGERPQQSHRRDSRAQLGERDPPERCAYGLNIIPFLA